ncbi:hypothetical protein D3C80_2170370 [compost metagenome]
MDVRQLLSDLLQRLFLRQAVNMHNGYICFGYSAYGQGLNPEIRIFNPFAH